VFLNDDRMEGGGGREGGKEVRIFKRKILGAEVDGT
jgi:hypothetical protein